MFDNQVLRKTPVEMKQQKTEGKYIPTLYLSYIGKMIKTQNYIEMDRKCSTMSNIKNINKLLVEKCQHVTHIKEDGWRISWRISEWMKLAWNIIQWGRTR